MTTNPALSPPVRLLTRGEVRFPEAEILAIRARLQTGEVVS